MPTKWPGRFLSLGSSHLSQFCKAVLHGCTTSNEELDAISHNGNLNLQASYGSQGNQNPFHTMCTEGWPWDIIVSQVEDTFPYLPQLVQAALNSSHGIAQEQKEIEIMASMASNYAHTKGLKKALQLAESTKPKCMPYIAAIGHYVQKFSGGSSFDTIHVLAHVSTLATYGTWLVCNVQQGISTVHFYVPSFPNVFAGKAFTNTLAIGEDFMTTIAFMDFKEKSTTFPWTRAGLLAANLQSPICKDGMGKLLHKSDVDKLKTPAMRANLISCEANLAHAYTTIQKHGLHATTDGKNLFARFLVRSILYVTKKQHKSRADLQFENFG